MATYRFVSWTDANGVELSTNYSQIFDIGGETMLIANYSPLTTGNILPWAIGGIGLVAVVAAGMHDEPGKKKKR